MTGDGIPDKRRYFQEEKMKTTLRILLCVLFAACLSLAAAIPQMTRAEESVYVSDLTWTEWKMYQSSSKNLASPYAPSFNQNEAGGTLTIAGKAYEKGIRMHPDTDGISYITYDVSAYDYTRFSATVGKDSLGGPGNVQFFVYYFL